MQPVSNEKSRDWCFRKNFCSDTDLAEMKQVLESNSTYYIISQNAFCLNSYITGYVIFPNPRIIGGIFKEFAHLNGIHGIGWWHRGDLSHKQTKNNIQQNKDLQKIYEWGVEPKQGERTDLILAKFPLKHTTNKILVIGDKNVGKTSMIGNWVNGMDLIKLKRIDTAYRPTIGIEQCSKTFYYGEYEHSVDICDLSGYELNSGMMPTYATNLSACIICVDLFSESSLKSYHTSSWLKYIEPHVPVYCVLTKYDLSTESIPILPYMGKRMTTTIPAYNGKFPDQLVVALSSQFEKLYEANNIINDNLSEPTNITKILELLSPIIPQLNVNGIKLVIEGNEVKLT